MTTERNNFNENKEKFFVCFFLWSWRGRQRDATTRRLMLAPLQTQISFFTTSPYSNSRPAIPCSLGFSCDYACLCVRMCLSVCLSFSSAQSDHFRTCTPQNKKVRIYAYAKTEERKKVCWLIFFFCFEHAFPSTLQRAGPTRAEQQASTGEHHSAEHLRFLWRYYLQWLWICVSRGLCRWYIYRYQARNPRRPHRLGFRLPWESGEEFAKEIMLH